MDGAMVMVAPGTLSENTTVSIRQISRTDLSVPLTDPNYEFIAAFDLNVGDDELDQPVQLAIPAPVGLTVGQQVFIMREGELQIPDGSFVKVWYLEESAVVGSDGMIRTQSPPFPGIRSTGRRVIQAARFAYDGMSLK